MNFDVEKINGMSELEFCGFTAGTLFLTNDEREKIGSTAMSSGLVKAKQLAQFFILQHRIYQTFPNESYDLADLVERYNIY
jgi:hypothetical protein